MAAEQHIVPSDCGRRLLNHTVDARARDNHVRPFAAIPLTNNPSDGYRDVSYSQFANAINRVAAWILATLGPPSKECEPFIYMAQADLRYHVVMLAAIKAGYIVGRRPFRQSSSRLIIKGLLAFPAQQ